METKKKNSRSKIKRREKETATTFQIPGKNLATKVGAKSEEIRSGWVFVKVPQLPY